MLIRCGYEFLPVQQTQSKVGSDEYQELLPYEAVDTALPPDEEAPYAAENARRVLVDAGESGLLQFLVLFRHFMTLVVFLKVYCQQCVTHFGPWRRDWCYLRSLRLSFLVGSVKVYLFYKGHLVKDICMKSARGV